MSKLTYTVVAYQCHLVDSYCWFPILTRFCTFFSTEDSEPVYDHPNPLHSHSDSDHERASSATPPFGNSSPHNTLVHEVYSEINQDEPENAHNKSRRNINLGQYLSSFLLVYWKQ